MGHCFGKVVVSRGKWALFWVNVGGWGIILGEWGWVGHYFGRVVVGGGEWEWMYCLIVPILVH